MGRGFALSVALLVAHSEARAGECGASDPECHLKNGSKLLASDPKAAAKELLASYQLDERTDTLTLYAQALQADGQWARALETWQRIITFRESEIVAAQEAMSAPSIKKRDKARAARAKAQDQSEAAAAEIMKLWGKVARVKIANTGDWMVTDDGIEVDASKEILVNAGRDELTFTNRAGASQKVVVELQPGQQKTLDAPKLRADAPVVMPVEPARPAPAPKPLPKVEQEPAPSPVEMTAKPEVSARWSEGPRSRTMSRVGIGLGVTGVIGLGVAGTLGYLAMRDFDNAKDLGCNDDGDCPLGEASRLAEKSRDRSVWAQITAAGGGALLVTGAALWFIGNKQTRRSDDISEKMTVGLTSNSLTLGWSLQ